MASYTKSSLEELKTTDGLHRLPSIGKILDPKKNPSVNKLRTSVQNGLPYSVFEEVQKGIDLPQSQLADILGIPARTITRRKEQNRFTSIESDRLYRVVRILAFTIDTLGSVEKARTWLKNPNRGLGGEIPLTYLDTDIGSRQVEDVLLRIRYGIYG